MRKRIRTKRGSGPKATLATALLLFAAVLSAGCGKSSSSDRATSSAAAASAEPSEEFNDPEGPNGVQPVATFGRESEESERSEASAVLTESLAAREEADFATQCSTLGRRGLESVFGAGKRLGDVSGCTVALEKLAKPLSQSEPVRVDTLSGEIAALRVEGDEGFALYHGNDGNDYEMPMEKEHGRWRVASIATLELPKTPPDSTKKAAGKEGN